MANLALSIKTPTIDPALWRRQGAEAARSEMDAGLQNLNLKQTTGEFNALESYRTAAERGEPKALDRLKGYPKIQADIYKALESMKPPERDAAAERAKAFAAAADTVLSFAMGSPEQVRAWNDTIDSLAAKGYASPQQADYWKKAGPSPLVIQQALTLGKTVKDFVTDQKARQLTPDQRIDIEKAVNDFRKEYFGSSNLGFLNDQQVTERDAKAEEYRRQLIEDMTAPPVETMPAGKSPVLDLTPRQPATAPAAPARTPTSIFSPQPMARQGGTQAPPPTAEEWKPGQPLPTSHVGAKQIKTRQELEALAPGTPVILPDGTPAYRK